ncbi:MAG: class III extradiol dioxygenase subunit B-like domain-containing protein [Nocardioidaceae bacterium]
MILAAAVCPHPPLLFRELGGTQDAVAALREACRESVRDAAAGADRVVLVGGAASTRAWDPALPPPVHRYGGARPPAGGVLPLSLGVGRRLLDEVGWSGAVEPVSVAWDATAADAEALAGDLARRSERLAVVALGDGSARRGTTAPGSLDERAFGFDDAIAGALAGGDAQALLDLDPRLAAELMVLGRAAFATLGALALAGSSGAVAPALRYRDDPFGVSYFVAGWTFG